MRHHDDCTAASLTFISGGLAKTTPAEGIGCPIKSDRNGLSSCFITRAVTFALTRTTLQDTVSDPIAVRGKRSAHQSGTSDTKKLKKVGGNVNVIH